MVTSVKDIADNSDIMSCVDAFIGHKCLVAIEHSHETDTGFFSDSDDDLNNNNINPSSLAEISDDCYERPQNPQLCRIHIRTHLKNTDKIISVEQTVTCEEPIEVGADVDGNLLAAHDNGRIAVIEAEGETNTNYVKYIGLEKSGDNTSFVRLPERAYSVHVIGKSVYIGFATSFGWVDFSVKRPQYVEVYRRQFGGDSTPNDRRYDMILHKGDLLILIGNLLGNYYAETFQLPPQGNNGPPIYQEPWPLPGTYAGRYTLVETAANNLMIVYGFVGRNRNGQCILRRSINELSPSARCQIEDIEKVRGSITNRNPYDCYKDQWWKSMAIQKTNRGEDDQILFAAGKQGVMTLPVKFQRTSAAQTIQESGGTPILTKGTEERVSSVRALGDETWVLINQGSPAASSTSCDDYTILMRLGNRHKIVLPGRFDELL